MKKQIFVIISSLLLFGTWLSSPVIAQPNSTLMNPDRRHAIRLGLSPGYGSADIATMEEDRFEDQLDAIMSLPTAYGYYPVPVQEGSSINYLNSGFFFQYRYMDRLRIGAEAIAVLAPFYSDESIITSNTTYYYTMDPALNSIFNLYSRNITDYMQSETRLGVEYFHPITENWMVGVGIGQESFRETVQGFEGFLFGEGSREREYNYSGLSPMIGTEFQPWRWLRISYYLQMPDLKGNYSDSNLMTDFMIGYFSNSYYSGDTSMKGLRHILDFEFRLARGYRMHVGFRSESLERTFSTVSGFGFSSLYYWYGVDLALMSGKFYREDRQIYMKYSFPIEFGTNSTPY